MNLKKHLCCVSNLSNSGVYYEDFHDRFHLDQFFLGSYVAYHFHISHFSPLVLCYTLSLILFKYIVQ